MHAATVPVPVAPSRRFAGVEGLRALAAGAVLLDHVYLYGAPDGERYDLGALSVVPRTAGTLGVVLFFTLSAFLLYRPFAQAVLEQAPRPSVRSYLRNRFLRVLPGYWLALLVAGLVLRTTYLPALSVEGRSLASEPEVLAANLLLVQGYFPSTLSTGIGPAWSLVVEMAFYLVLPLLAAGAALLALRTAAGRRWSWAAALAPAAFLLVLGQVGAKLAYALPGAGEGTWSGSWHAVVLRSFLGHASLFGAGLALAVLYVQVSRGRVVLPGRWWRPVAGGTALAVVVPAMIALSDSRVTENRATLAFSVGCVLVLALVVLPRERPSLLVSLLASRPLQAAGVVSYGVFLWNEPLVWWLKREGLTLGGTLGLALALLTTAAVTGAVAAVSWRLVERPALSLKRRWTAAPPDALPSAPVPPQRAPAASGQRPEVVDSD